MRHQLWRNNHSLKRRGCAVGPRRRLIIRKAAKNGKNTSQRSRSDLAELNLCNQSKVWRPLGGKQFHSAATGPLECTFVLQWLCFTEFSWLKYKLLMIALQDCNLYKCNSCAKGGRKHHWNRGAFQLVTPLNSAPVTRHSGPARSRSAPLSGSWNPVCGDVWNIFFKNLQCLDNVKSF